METSYRSEWKSYCDHTKPSPDGRDAAFEEVCALSLLPAVSFEEAISTISVGEKVWLASRSGFILEITKSSILPELQHDTRLATTAYDLDGNPVEQRSQISESDAWYALWIADFHKMNTLLPLQSRPSFLKSPNEQLTAEDIRISILRKYRAAI